VAPPDGFDLRPSPCAGAPGASRPPSSWPSAWGPRPTASPASPRPPPDPRVELVQQPPLGLAHPPHQARTAAQQYCSQYSAVLSAVAWAVLPRCRSNPRLDPVECTVAGSTTILRTPLAVNSSLGGGVPLGPPSTLLYTYTSYRHAAYKHTVLTLKAELEIMTVYTLCTNTVCTVYSIHSTHLAVDGGLGDGVL